MFIFGCLGFTDPLYLGSENGRVETREEVFMSRKKKLCVENSTLGLPSVRFSLGIAVTLGCTFKAARIRVGL